jgi:phosphoglycerate dehydrogenase-like enzyme/glyoxylase-like metal-dependent hydrolase (beta-lactamase superfamily II)
MYRFALLLLLVCSIAQAELPKMKFNDVREIAPGVFFRLSSISPTDPSVFGGSNHVWVVFKEYVVVIDANFPKEAGDVIEAIKKTTNKPIRYVLDTHHHGDHAWGNSVWIKEGATVIAHKNCAKLLRTTGPADFLAAGKGPAGRKDVAASKLDFPTLIFDDKLILDDGEQRVEFMQLGHSHTIGDAVAWLPKQGILCTGDACVNGAYNYMGHSNSASWIRALERMQGLDVKIVAPGHGVLDTKDLLARQKRYFVELRQQVKKGIDAGKDVEDIVKSIDMPWYKEWTTVTPSSDNIKHVYNEYMGLVAPWDFEYDFGILAGETPTKDSPGWTKPKRILIPAGLSPERLAQLKRAAPEVEFVPARTPEEAAKLVAGVDAVIGFATPEVIQAGKNLRWVQASAADVALELLKSLEGRKISLCDTRKLSAPRVADQTFALLLSLTRNLRGKSKTPPSELAGKRLLLIGLGTSGNEIAKRASAFGMDITAITEGELSKPEFVAKLGRLSDLDGELSEADVVVLAAPVSDKTKGLIGEKQLAKMKKGAFLINAAHTGLVQMEALAKASEIGVALDTTDIGELPASHPLRKLPNVVLTTTSKKTDLGDLQWRLYRENVRRFAAGEALLGVVSVK